MSEVENPFIKLAAIDVGQHVEKKQNLSYLSWAWAVDQLMRADPAANWEFHEPITFGKTMMVSCTVTAFGKPIKMHLPVMDHRNKAVEDPDAFVVNKNMMRCLVKAIACHGLGLYIYAGEDLPADEDGNPAPPPQRQPQQRQQPIPASQSVSIPALVAAMEAAGSMEELQATFKSAWKESKGDASVKASYDSLKSKLTSLAEQA